MSNFASKAPLLIEFHLAHATLRHECVRLKSVIVAEAYCVTVAIAFVCWPKMAGELSASKVSLLWCIVANIIAIGALASIILARRDRRRIVSRVNYLRNAIIRDATFTNTYKRIAGFPRETVPMSQLFLLPQLVAAAAFVVASGLGVTYCLLILLRS